MPGPDLNKLADVLADAIRKDIRKKDLIDTGKMLNSIDAVARKTPDGIEIDILAVDYFKYVSGNYDVLDDAIINNREFDKAIEDVVDDIITNIIDID